MDFKSICASFLEVHLQIKQMKSLCANKHKRNYQLCSLSYLLSRSPTTSISRMFLNASQHSFTTKYIKSSFLIFLRRLASFPTKSLAMLNAVTNCREQVNHTQISVTSAHTYSRSELEQNRRPYLLEEIQANESCQITTPKRMVFSSNLPPCLVEYMLIRFLQIHVEINKYIVRKITCCLSSPLLASY